MRTNTGSKLEKGPYVLSLGNCIVEKVSFSSIKRRSDGPAFWNELVEWNKVQHILQFEVVFIWEGEKFEWGVRAV